MSDELREAGAERLAAQASPPLHPAARSGSGAAMGAALRVHALEYIAAQLGQINAKLDIIIRTFPQSRQND